MRYRLSGPARSIEASVFLNGTLSIVPINFPCSENVWGCFFLASLARALAQPAYATEGLFIVTQDTAAVDAGVGYRVYECTSTAAVHVGSWWVLQMADGVFVKSFLGWLGKHSAPSTANKKYIFVRKYKDTFDTPIDTYTVRTFPDKNECRLYGPAAKRPVDG